MPAQGLGDTWDDWACLGFGAWSDMDGVISGGEDKRFDPCLLCAA